MNVIKESVNRKGKRQVTVVLDEGESILAVHQDRHYMIGYPHDEVMPGYVLTELAPVSWCSLEQKWRT